MGNIISTSEPVPANAPDATPGKIMASLNFYETPVGAMAIEALHTGEFDPNIQQHRLLQIILDFLPQIVDPANFDQSALEAAPEQTHESTETRQ